LNEPAFSQTRERTHSVEKEPFGGEKSFASFKKEVTLELIHYVLFRTFSKNTI